LDPLLITDETFNKIFSEADGVGVPAVRDDLRRSSGEEVVVEEVVG
jgi:hypothetical protein